MVNVAQLVEHQVVALGVVGSTPTIHPILRIPVFENIVIGVLALAFGSSILIESIFGFKLPIVRITLGILTMLWGICLIFLNQ
jgi:hypothetical protein